MIIRIKNLRAETTIGAYPEERLTKRIVLVNVEIVYDAAAAIASDKLADALDYAALEHMIVTSLAEQQFVLIERLAAHVASLIAEHSGVSSVMVEVDKPGALAHAESVSVVHRCEK